MKTLAVSTEDASGKTSEHGLKETVPGRDGAAQHLIKIGEENYLFHDERGRAPSLACPICDG